MLSSPDDPGFCFRARTRELLTLMKRAKPAEGLAERSKSVKRRSARMAAPTGFVPHCGDSAPAELFAIPEFAIESYRANKTAAELPRRPVQGCGATNQAARRFSADDLPVLRSATMS